jgi:Tfp pilus assembly protein FimV
MALITKISGPITLADVKSALADKNPNSTNAAAVRQIMGRGSFATIQKHLDTMRAELVPAPPVAPGAAPTAPAEAVSVIWGAAWSAAQALTLGRLETVTAERDAAQALTAAQAQDVAALAAEVDTLTAAAEAQAIEQAQALAEAQATAEQATAQAAAQAQELAAARAEIERVTTAAKAAAALAEREAEIKAQALQAAIDRQIDKYMELKSVVDRLKPIKTP